MYNSSGDKMAIQKKDTQSVSETADIARKLKIELTLFCFLLSATIFIQCLVYKELLHTILYFVMFLSMIYIFYCVGSHKNASRVQVLLWFSITVAIFAHQIFKNTIKDNYQSLFSICLLILAFLLGRFILRVWFGKYRLLFKRKEDEETADERMIQNLFQKQDALQKKTQNRAIWEQRKQTRLNKYWVALIVFLYGSMIAFYSIIAVLILYFPKEAKGLAFIQRSLLYSCLFTAFIYSLPMIMIFLKRLRLSKITLCLCVVTEILRCILVFPDNIYLMRHEQYGNMVYAIWILFEIVRYYFLIKFTVSFFQHPLFKIKDENS